MAKLIKMSPEYIQSCKDDFQKEFEKAVSNIKVSDGKLQFTRTIGQVDRKATVVFSTKAYLKMTALIREFGDEVAWHGTAYRSDDETKDVYIIDDILVYPQVVTGATVNTDQEKYQTWLMSQSDDVFNNIRFQGHSHVNMGVSPSGVDTSHQEKIVEQLEDDMFYIFMIWNKRHDVFSKIYDMKKNIMFESSDVTVDVVSDGECMSEFMKNAKAIVEKRTYQSPYQSSTYQGGGVSYQNYAQNSPKPNDNKTSGDKKSTDSQKDKKKDKKKEKKKTSAKDGSYVQPSGYASRQMAIDDYDCDDENDPNSPFYVREGPWNAYGIY